MQEENNIYFFVCKKSAYPPTLFAILYLIIFSPFLFILKMMCMLQKVKKKNMVVPKMNVYINYIYKRHFFGGKKELLFHKNTSLSCSE